jgi:small-conductance mechanosensitive channel
MIKSLLNTTFLKNFGPWIESAFLFAVVFCIGFLFKKYVTKFMQNILAKVGFILPDDMVIVSGKYISFWFFIIALYVAFLKSPVNNAANTIIHKSFYTAFAFSIVVLVASIASRFFRKFVHEKIGSNIIKISIIFTGLALILSQIGIKLTPVLTLLGGGTLAASLALKDTLANLFSGINILASKQISKNDYIKLDSGQEGTVLEVNWRTTLIREISNAIVTIPNSKVSSAIITSFHHQGAQVSVSINCGVAYGSDLNYVEKIAKLAAQEMIDEHENSIKTYAPIVHFTGFGDSSINFTLVFRVKDIYARAFMQSQVLKNLYKKFNETNIEIPFPQRVVTMNKS